MRKIKLNINGTQRVLGFKPALFSQKHKVFLDAQEIGTFQNAKEAKEGKEFRIDQDNRVVIKYKQVILTPELHVLLNGHPIEESANHPVTRKKAAFVIIILLAILNLVIGSMGISNSVNAISQAGFGVYNLMMGIFYIIALGIFKKTNPFLGIVLALVIYSIDTAVVLYSIKDNPGITGGLIVRIMFFTVLIQALKVSWLEFKAVFSKT